MDAHLNNMEVVYHILNWNDHFENNKSREIESCRWVCMPNKQDGLGLMRILSETDGAAIFGVWCLVIQACSRHKVRDGWLTEDGSAVGLPWELDDLGLRWRRPVAEIHRALDFTCSPKMNWMEKIKRSAVMVPDDGTPRVSKTQREGKKEGREGPTTPGKERPALALMKLLLLSTQERAVEEWKILAKAEAHCDSTDEILAFLEWAVTTARDRGRTVEYAKHCLPEAREWKNDLRARRGYQKPKDAA